MSIRRVTVGVDGSPASRTAVDWAIERGRHTAMTLELLTVVPDTFGDTELTERIRRTYETNLSELLTVVRQAAPSLAVSPAVRTGSVAAELARASEETDLLVIGTDKASALREFVYGTVPLRLAALTAAPLVVVPKSWSPGSASVVLAVGDDEPYETARDFAVAEAEARNLPLELIHVWAPAPNYPSPLSMIDYPWESVEQASRQNLESTADRIRTAHPGLAVSSQLQEGPTIPRLVESAQGAQLLVVGRGGRGILRDLLQLGSVAHDVLLNPPAPVAVVPAQRRQEKLDDLAERAPGSAVRS